METKKHGDIDVRHGKLEKWRHGHRDMDIEAWTGRHGQGNMDRETWKGIHGHGDMDMET